MPGNDSFTKVLLHFDNNYNDDNAGGSAHTWSPSNSPSFSATAKFGTNSFQGTAPHPAAPATPARFVSTPDSIDFALSTQDFTIDFWANTNLGSQTSNLATQPNAWIILRNPFGNTIQFQASADGSNFSLLVSSPSSAWANGAFKHIALVRQGTTFTMYVDGVGGTPVTSSINIFNSSSDLQLILSSGGAETVLYDEFRLSVGVARWTSNFTPPTAAYGADTTAVNVSIPCTTSTSLAPLHPIRAVLAQIAAATAVTIQKSALKLIAISFPALVTVSQAIARIVRNSLYKVRSNAPTLDRSRANSSALQKSRASDPVLDE